MTGAVLADLITRTNTTNYVLVGHSLGARVMFSAAQALGSRNSDPQLESVHLLGAAVSAGHDLTNVGNAVSDTVWNYWSRNDAILASCTEARSSASERRGQSDSRTVIRT